MGLTSLNRPLEAPTSPVEAVSVANPMMTRDDIISYIKTKDWDGDTAVAIMLAESSASTTDVNWNDHHKGCDGSAGLFQVACIHAPVTEMQKPRQNIDEAFLIYESKGNFDDWSTFKSGAYRKFL